MGAWSSWENPNYCWGVICKNERVHHQTNLMSGHKILLAETDAFEPLPVSGPFQVVCDDCGEEYTYEPKDVLRLEQQPPENFTTHPRFR